MATELLAAGTLVKTVGAMLGHTNAATTMNVVPRDSLESDRDAAEVMARRHAATEGGHAPVPDDAR